MGLGQTLLTTGVLVLISVAVIGINKMVSDKDIAYYDKKAIEQSGILANALLDEISTKKFDSSVDTSDWGYASSSTFDGSGSLGPASSALSYVNPGGSPDTFTPFRSMSNAYYDDVDDYKGYYRTTSAGGLTGFRLWVDVNYVTAASVITSSRTYYKKVDVRVSNVTYMADTLIFSRVIAY